MPAQDVELPFPIRGVSRGFSFNRSSPETTHEAVNVIPYDPAEHRFRGGSRPGFSRLSSLFMSGPPVFLVSFASLSDPGERFRQSFIAGTVDDIYVNQPTETVVNGRVVYGEEFVSLAGTLLTEEDAGIGGAYVQPGGGAYLQPDGVSTYIDGYNSIDNVLTTEDGSPLLSASFSFAGQRSFATPFQGSVVVPGTGEVIAEGVGRLVNGEFTADDVEDWSGKGIRSMDHILELLPVDNSRLLPASYVINFDYGGKLSVSSGQNRGRCSYRIVDGPKLISAKDRSVKPLSSHIGSVPVGAELVTTYLDRLVFVKDRVWYMSRQGDAGDWNYGADAGDRGRAVAGVSSDAGQPGDPIIAMASRGNDYLVMFARETTWVMRGDPAGGGTLMNLSRTYGCVDPQAWCHGDGGEIYFLSKEGLCVIPDGVGSRPEPVSSEFVPNDLRNADAGNNYVSLAFDLRYRGVWVFLTPKDGSTGTHWWYSKLTSSFWPIRFGDDQMQPTAAVVHTSSPSADSAVVIGDSTGSLRIASPGDADDTSPVSSRVVLGPFLAAESAWQDGLLTRFAAMLGSKDSTVSVAVYGASSQEDAVKRAVAGGTPNFTTTVAGLRTRTILARVRCVAFCVVISSSSAWGFESLVATLGAAGNARL